MTKTRNIADLLDANGDVVSGALDNVPASNNASALTTGTLPSARLGTVTSFRSTGIDDNCSALRMTLTNDDTTMAGHLKLDYGSSNGNPKISFLQNNYSGATNIEVNRSVNDLLFNVNSSERVRINANGQLLVGTTDAPSSADTKLKVHVPITSSGRNAIEISQNTTGSDKPGASLGLVVNNSGSSTNAAELTFSTASGGSLSEKLRITSAGNLGIGTTSPSEKLEVVGTVKATQFVGGGLNPYRNIIINGDMSIAQRATSVTGITSSSFNTIDRMRTIVGSIGTWTQSQSTDVPTGQGFFNSLKMDCTTAEASPSAGSSLSVMQKIEGQNVQYLKKGTSSAESLTASFWVKSNKTGTYILELFDKDNSRIICKSYTISSANTWEKKIITYDGDTTGSLDNDNATSLQIKWHLGNGSDFTSGTLQTSWGANTNANRAVGQVNLADSTSNEWYITGIQLEAGTSASDFEFLPFDINFQRCKRYFQNLAPQLDNIRMGIGENKNTTISGVYIKFEPEMRTTPSFSSTAANTFSLYHSATDRVASNLLFDSKSSKGGNIDVTVSSGLLDGGASQFLTASTSSRLDFSAEL